eukprot:4158307-Prymnesium_polylepis.1
MRTTTTTTTRSRRTSPPAHTLIWQEPEDEDAAFDAEVADTVRRRGGASPTTPIPIPILTLVRRGVEEGHSVDNLALEINGLKFAQNRARAHHHAALSHKV